MRLIRTLLLVGGMAGISVWIAATVAPMLSDDWDNWVFEREMQGQPTAFSQYVAERSDQLAENVRAWWEGRAPNKVSAYPTRVTPPSPQTPEPPVPQPIVPPQQVLPDQALIGRMTIPRLNLSTVVREGVHETTLGIAAGHVPGTALPGDNSNVAVAGHRDTLFRKLRGIKTNDLIQFETLKGTYVYQVESTRIVKPSEVSVLKPTPYSELTLVTCYPFTYIGSAPDRFIVTAREILDSAATPDRSGTFATASTDGAKAHDAAATAKPDHSSSSKIDFSLIRNHSRQLTQGISIGVTRTDPYDKTVDGWIWVMPDRRTTWLRHQRLHQPLVFYQDGHRRELSITSVSKNGASGYLVLPDGGNVTDAGQPDSHSSARLSLNK